ncbi:Peptidase M16 C-terminal domain containing protein [Cryptosporidium felis]|nr:Peptidase M16 C-terminal domain containing protein [Cryptosporidium felis]
MPIEKKEVFKAIFKSRERKPVKEEKEVAVKRRKFVKSHGRYFVPDSVKTRERVKEVKKDLKRSGKRTRLTRYFDNKAISKSSPLDSRLGTYYEFENGLEMSILTTEGSEVSSISLNIEISGDEIRQEKIPGLYHFMIQLLLSEKFIEIEHNWNPLEPVSFREYVQEIGGKLSVQYIPSYIMLSVGCLSKDFVKMLEHLFDAIYLTKKGTPRRLKLRKSSIEEALVSLKINHLESIHDENYLRFEILRDILKRRPKSVQRTTNHKTIDVIKFWNLGSESRLLTLIKEGNLEAEVMAAYKRVISNKTILALHSNLTNKKLFKILCDYNPPILHENSKSDESLVRIRYKSKGPKKEGKESSSNSFNADLPPVAILDIKPSIIVSSQVSGSKNSNAEIEIQWIIPAFYSSLVSSNSKPLKVISSLLESGGLFEFLSKRKMVNSINSGEVYFAAHSSTKLGFTIFSLMIKLSEQLESKLDPNSSFIQFIVQSVFAYFNSLIGQIENALDELSSTSSSGLNLGESDGEAGLKNIDNQLFHAINDVLKIENYLSNSNYQMNSEKENYIDYFDRNFEITEVAIQNMKSHNPSEVLVGNNRFYSKIRVLLKYVKFTLDNALKPSNFVLFISSDSFFEQNLNRRSRELKFDIQNAPSVRYLELEFDSAFLHLLKDPATLKKYVIKLDPLKQVVLENNLTKEYEFLVSPHPLLKCSELTFLDGEFEWEAFSGRDEDENPIEGTTPYISAPQLISEDEKNSLLVYYSRINYPNETSFILQSSISSAIFRWYDNTDYSQALRNKGNNGNLALNSTLSSFISRMLFTLWVAMVLASNIISYKKIGATLNFQPCHYFGSALSSDCVQLQVTSPSPMFPEYLKEVLMSIRTVSMLDISEELSKRLKRDSIREVELSMEMSGLANSCSEKVKQIFLPEVISNEQVLEELKRLTSDEIAILLDNKLDLQNPNISVIGLITHLDEPRVGIEVIKESMVSNVCFSNLSSLSAFRGDYVEIFTPKHYPHPVLDDIDSRKTRLVFSASAKKAEGDEDSAVSVLWMSVYENNLQNKSFLILLARLVQYIFKSIYLPTSLLVNKADRKSVNLVVIPSPFLRKMGLQFILEVKDSKAFSSHEITTSSLLMDFLLFIESRFLQDQKSEETNKSTEKSNLLHYSLKLTYKQIKTEVILQLLLSQTQIVSQSSFLFGRIVEFFESKNSFRSEILNLEVISQFAKEKELINNIIKHTSLKSAISFFESMIKDSSMILVESRSNEKPQNSLQNDLLVEFGFRSGDGN